MLLARGSVIRCDSIPFFYPFLNPVFHRVKRVFLLIIIENAESQLSYILNQQTAREQASRTVCCLTLWQILCRIPYKKTLEENQ